MTHKLRSNYKDNFQKYRQDILEELITIRHNCEALRKVFLPDNKWKEYTYQSLGIFDQSEGYHESLVFKALMDGKLNLVTSPIHKFLLNENARDDYRNNINDYWFVNKSFGERKKIYYRNYGKFYDLLVAEWLENNNWEIVNLEAWDENSSDIEAKSPDKELCAIEIKTYFKNIDALENQNKGKGYFGCGEDPAEIEEKYSFLIKKADEKLEAIADKKRIIAIIDIEDKVGRYNTIYHKSTTAMLNEPIKNCNELWIIKIDSFKLTIKHKLASF